MANHPLRITYEEGQILGRGGYGMEFKGTLFTEQENHHHQQVQVAVKRIFKKVCYFHSRNSQKQMK